MHGIRPFQNKGEEKDSLNLSQGANPPRSAAKTVLRLLPVNCANGHHGHTHGRTTHVCITVHQRFKKAMRLVQPMYDISHHPSFPLTRQGEDPSSFLASVSRGMACTPAQVPVSGGDDSAPDAGKKPRLLQRILVCSYRPISGAS
jgi:hypothetical protein